MKWTNKGYQFEEIGQIFLNIEKIYIYGLGEYGKILYEFLKKSDCKIYFIDIDDEKQEKGYKNCEVLSPLHFFNKQINENEMVIVAAGEHNTSIIIKKLILMGYKENINCFSFNRFKQFYGQIFMLYKYNKLCIKTVDISLTQKCNLRCKDCSILTPYEKTPIDRKYEDICFDIDLFFKRVDYLQTLYLIGGEPFIYSRLEDICIYISEKYSKYIDNIIIATNGLIIPGQSLLNVLFKYNISCQISDYSKSLKSVETNVNKFVEALKEYNISYNRMIDMSWVDYGFRHVQKNHVSNAEMEYFFEMCGIDCRCLENGNLYYCFPSKMSKTILDKKEDITNAYKLTEINSNYKKELLEFDNGFNEYGYIEMCRRCNGCYLINTNFIEVAKQL